jgi:hypothetical protein
MSLTSTNLQRFFFKLKNDEWKNIILVNLTTSDMLSIINEISFADWKNIIYDWYKKTSSNFSFLELDKIQSYFDINNPYAPDQLLQFFNTQQYSSSLKILFISLCSPVYLNHLKNIIVYMHIDTDILKMIIEEQNIQTLKKSIGIL